MMSRQHVHFLIAILLTVISILLSAIWFGGSTFYCRHVDLLWEVPGCYKFSIADQGFDALLVGDSALSAGVRPKLIEDRTGIRSFNLGLPGGAYLYAPNLLLDAYLQRNRKPKLIILYISPWTRPADVFTTNASWYEGAGMLLREGSARQVYEFFRRDPRRLVQYPALVLQQLVLHFDPRGSWWREAVGEMTAEQGWLAIWRPERKATRQPARLSESCDLRAKRLKVDTEFLHDFRRRYEGGGTTVAIYVAPVPDCDRSLEQIREAYAEVADNQPMSLPSSYFFDDGRRAHVTVDGAAAATRLVGDFLLEIGDRACGAGACRRRAESMNAR